MEDSQGKVAKVAKGIKVRIQSCRVQVRIYSAKRKKPR
jgi:hypothetical protein